MWEVETGRMTPPILTCAGCFSDYEPTREDILKGIKHWRLCPNCRAEDGAELPATAEERCGAA